jgi:hypothetical protein
MSKPEAKNVQTKISQSKSFNLKEENHYLKEMLKNSNKILNINLEKVKKLQFN